MPLREDSPQIPETPYGTTKLAAERMIRDYARAYDLGYAILRYFNASGADPDGQHGEDRRHESHLIPLTLQVAVGRREKLLIYGGDWPTRDGTCVRDYVHTDDLAQAHQLAVENIGPGIGPGLQPRLGHAARRSWRCCGPARRSSAGRSRTRSSAVGPATRPSWSPRPRRSTASWAIGRAPDIRQIVETAWRWHESHPDGYNGAGT